MKTTNHEKKNNLCKSVLALVATSKWVMKAMSLTNLATAGLISAILCATAGAAATTD